MSSLVKIVCVGALLLGGCATPGSGFSAGPDALLSSLSIPEQWTDKDIDGFEQNWLQKLEDPALRGLVAEAEAHNPNLQMLAARVDRARAQSRKARAGLQPNADFVVGGNRTDNFESSQNSSANINLGLDVGWEADLWGRIGATAQASDLTADAVQADYNAARQILAANVAENYYLAIEAEKLADVSKRNLEALNKTLGFVTVQYERGLRSGQDISLIRTDVASAKVDFNRAQNAARDAKRALEILLGHYPGADISTTNNLPDAPALNAIGQPADILTRRPDLRAAKFRVDAGFQFHKAARAAQKPSLTLSGAIDGGSNVIGTLFNPANLASTLLANVTAPVFDGGRRKADIAIAQADMDEAVAAYRETAIAAYLDVERQLDLGHVLAEQETELTRAFADAKDALKFTQFQYESGENDLLNVLSVQQRVSFIEGRLVSTRRARLTQYISLALALGGTP